MRLGQTLIHFTQLAMTSAAVLLSGYGAAHSSPLLTSLADPTQPPPAFRKKPVDLPQSVNTGMPPNVAQVEQPTSTQEAPPARMPKLQSIHRDTQTGRASAMLDGQVRQQGERFGTWILQTIETDAVMLRGSSVSVRLRLLGGHEKLKQWPGPAATSSQKDQP